MKEQDLIDLGFQRKDISVEESGDKPYFYFTYNFTDEFCLISSDNNEAKKNGWFVEIFDYYDIKFSDKEEVKNLIEIIERNKL